MGTSGIIGDIVLFTVLARVVSENVKYQREEIKMSRQNIVRCTCERCNKVEEISGGIFTRYPQGWKTIEGKHVCAKCSSDFDRDFKDMFAKWMAEGRKK